MGRYSDSDGLARMKPPDDSAEADERLLLADELMTATALLYFRMRVAAQQLLGEGELSAGRRSVLRDLATNGPQTVPQLARTRAVSRQHIQGLVNGLEQDGLVERGRNPAHKRSPLFRPTAAGTAIVEATRQREARLIPRVTAGIPLADLQKAKRVLVQLKEAFESDEWRDALAEDGGDRSRPSR